MATVPNNPLTKFPTSFAPPGHATLSSPQHTNVTPHPTAHTPIGPVAIGRPVALTPVANTPYKKGGNFQGVQTQVSQAIQRSR